MSNLDSIQSVDDLQQACRNEGILYANLPLVAHNIGVGALIKHDDRLHLLLEDSLSDADKISTAQALLAGQAVGNA